MNDKHVRLITADSVAQARLLFTTMTDKQQADKAQLFFDSSVLEKYRSLDGYRIIRTDTTGRLSKQGSWSVDFGISGDDDAFLHIAAQAWVYRIPKDEQTHWLSHMLTLPMSENYLRGLIRAGCIDDGDIRTW
ncbi:hypothetical protein [Alicyclobacillus dauci]|uniref:Uncharacterized protein n=1 Tax=Alicyclobacillus dauci TaxID=1475485 RepID=A0ABY6Z7Q1_9BACL|nr:hypothetical protein [Alicyclobacillus dauci]WAH38933.1 hypothetical protein NZD86_10855 [Alicyclobacillus dauci]